MVCNARLGVREEHKSMPIRYALLVLLRARIRRV